MAQLRGADEDGGYAPKPPLKAAIAEEAAPKKAKKAEPAPAKSVKKAEPAKSAKKAEVAEEDGDGGEEEG